jgi:multidrug efflux pump subunit AcrB
VAELSFGTGFSTIIRAQGLNALDIHASINHDKTNSQGLLRQLESAFLPQLKSNYPGLSCVIEGKEKDKEESMGDLFKALALTLVLIYFLMAIPLKSYFQPVLILFSVPFGFVGALVGHLLVGYDLSIISFLGCLALAGVVVNDSIMLVDCYNRNALKGQTSYDALLSAGARRFRPIFLTSVTTFVGLLPIVFDTNVQARFVAPMAVSLGFGVLFGTVIALFILPALCLLFEDAKSFIHNDRC